MRVAKNKGKSTTQLIKEIYPNILLWNSGYTNEHAPANKLKKSKSDTLKQKMKKKPLRKASGSLDSFSEYSN